MESFGCYYFIYGIIFNIINSGIIRYYTVFGVIKMRNIVLRKIFWFFNGFGFMWGFWDYFFIVRRFRVFDFI